MAGTNVVPNYVVVRSTIAISSRFTEVLKMALALVKPTTVLTYCTNPSDCLVIVDQNNTVVTVISKEKEVPNTIIDGRS